jgi:hypothetical protein
MYDNPNLQMRIIRLLCYWVVVAALAITGRAAAGDYTEIGSGDLSGNRLAPTAWTLSGGTNRLIAGTSPGDQEYLRVNLPAGLKLDTLVVQFYTSSDKMFLGMQQGTTFTVAPETATAADMYGYVHFGASADNVGTDVLDDMGVAPGAVGFTPPLASGSYTFWLQQGTAGVTTYQLNFNVSGPPGDYNGNGAVDAADYTVWRNTVGSESDFRADGTGPTGTPDHVVDGLDYNFWKQRYGEGTGSGTSDAEMVPEPMRAPLICLAVIGLSMVCTRALSPRSRARKARARSC